MQNKANFLKDQMDVSFFYKMAYENKHNWTLGENKPNLSQLKPISMPIKPRQSQFQIGRQTTEDRVRPFGLGSAVRRPPKGVPRTADREAGSPRNDIGFIIGFEYTI